MRCTHSITVVFFHKLNVSLHIFYRHGVSLCHVSIMVINSKQFYRLSVKQKYISVNADVFKSYISPYCFNNIFFVFQYYVNFIKRRGFSSPFFYRKCFYFCFIRFFRTASNNPSDDISIVVSSEKLPFTLILRLYVPSELYSGLKRKSSMWFSSCSII